MTQGKLQAFPVSLTLLQNRTPFVSPHAIYRAIYLYIQTKFIGQGQGVEKQNPKIAHN